LNLTVYKTVGKLFKSSGNVIDGPNGSIVTTGQPYRLSGVSAGWPDEVEAKI